MLQICLVSYFIWEPAKTALSQQMTVDKQNDEHEGKLTTYFSEVSYLLERDTFEDVIFKAEDEVTNFIQSVQMYAVQYSQSLWRRHLDVAWYKVYQY